jgi:uncharacterized protein YkwD
MLVWVWIIIAIVLLCVIIYNLNHGIRISYRLKERRRSRQLKIINHYRRKHRLPPLKVYYELDRIAKSHSKYMARHCACNHNGFADRATRVRKVTGSGIVAENCFRYPARHYNTRLAIKLVKGWMKSPGHRANLLNPNFKRLGIGIIVSKNYCYATQIFSG